MFNKGGKFNGHSSKVTSHESLKKYVPACPVFAGPVTYKDIPFIIDVLLNACLYLESL